MFVDLVHYPHCVHVQDDGIYTFLIPPVRCLVNSVAVLYTYALRHSILFATPCVHVHHVGTFPVYLGLMSCCFCHCIIYVYRFAVLNVQCFRRNMDISTTCIVGYSCLRGHTSIKISVTPGTKWPSRSYKLQSQWDIVSVGSCIASV